MKRLFTLISLTILTIATLSAQEKVKEREVVSSTYNRSSVSYVMINRNWSHSKDVQTFFNTLKVGEKYDENRIATNYITLKHNSGIPVTSTQVTEAINSQNLGREVMSFLFNRQADGNFDDTIVKERGLYNAKDQDIQNLAIAKVQDQSFAWGEALINSAYIIVLDIYNTTETRQDNGSISYTAKCSAHAFKLAGDESVLNNFYLNGWADAYSTAEERASAVAAYDNMQFDLKYVTSVSVTGSSTKSKYSDGSMAQACLSAYNNVVYNLEKVIPAWKTVVSVVSTNPIAAKIGTKESLKNGDRFQTYSYKEDRDGKLKSVKHGMIRATVVANNKGVATGNTKPSYFYQISGALNVQEGYILQQKNDLKLGAALAVGSTPNGIRVGLDMDYLCNISKRGCITYALINMGFDTMDKEYNGVGSLVDVSIGAGYGIPFTRFVEITPLINVGGYMKLEDAGESVYDNTIDDNYDTTESTSDKFAGYFVEPGARLALTLQPLSLFVSGGYHLAIPTIPGITIYSGMFIKGGIKWTF